MTDTRQWTDEEWKRFEASFDRLNDKVNIGWYIDLTIGQDEHPEWYESPCECDLCRSYGD